MATTHPRFKAAVVQAAPVFLDLDATVEKGCALIEEAASKGAELIVFPEVWIPGYPWWIWLGSPAWGMPFFARYHDNSMVVGDRYCQKLCDTARRNDIHVVMGFSEKEGGSLYIAQLFIDREGEILGTRRKLKPTHVERTVYGEGDGSGFKVFELDIGRIGGLCCWEHLQPLSRFAMYSLGEQIHAASWPSFSLYRGAAYALGPELNTAATQMYAAEGQCFALMSVAVVDDRIIEMVVDTEEKAQLLLKGGGFANIFGPDGRPLVEPIPETEEGLLMAELDLALIVLAKAAADPVGHYSRPDVVRLLLNPNPAPRVHLMQPPLSDIEPCPPGEMAEEV